MCFCFPNMHSNPQWIHFVAWKHGLFVLIILYWNGMNHAVIMVWLYFHRLAFFTIYLSIYLSHQPHWNEVLMNTHLAAFHIITSLKLSTHFIWTVLSAIDDILNQTVTHITSWTFSILWWMDESHKKFQELAVVLNCISLKCQMDLFFNLSFRCPKLSSNMCITF